LTIRFDNSKLERLCNNGKELKQKHQRRADTITQRLGELAAIENLEQMKLIPAARCHQLRVGNRKGQFAVNVDRMWRIVFEPDHDPRPLKPDGGIDLKQVTAINIIEIVDYHEE